MRRKTSMDELIIRPALEEDAPTVCSFIKQLAEYEKMSDMVTVNDEIIRRLLAEEKAINALIAEKNGLPVGFAVYNFYLLSTFSGRRIMYLEDLFLIPSERGKGTGRKLIAELCRIAVEKNCLKIEWKCLDWNVTSIEFYKKIGAVSDNGWLTFTLSEKNFSDFS
jgi:GNAT superfamily N-acetyltransferase